ncbi:hypothetical protein [Nonomuraea sp. NPDC003804]|uniref:hypothetical protein n=1 Tax=Nonomuraea sp. NPDC003804 TaxID=3154547 RepID=UPI0033B0B89C
MSEITPEKVASALTDGSGEWWDSLESSVSLAAKDNVLSVELTRWDEDGEEDTENVMHFRAVVVEAAPRSRVHVEMDGLCPGLCCESCGVFTYIDDGEDFDSVIASRDAHRCPPSAEAAQAEQSGGAE